MENPESTLFQLFEGAETEDQEQDGKELSPFQNLTGNPPVYRPFSGADFAQDPSVLVQGGASFPIGQTGLDGPQSVALSTPMELESEPLAAMLGDPELGAVDGVLGTPALGAGLGWPNGTIANTAGLGVQNSPWSFPGQNIIDTSEARSRSSNPQRQRGSKRARGQDGTTLSPDTMRMARNGREQQRAHKISDLIDQMKGIMDGAAYAMTSSSKLHVLNSCESYLRSLQNRARCFEMERQLRGTVKDLDPRDGEDEGYAEGDGSGGSCDGDESGSGDSQSLGDAVGPPGTCGGGVVGLEREVDSDRSGFRDAAQVGQQGSHYSNTGSAQIGGMGGRAGASGDPVCGGGSSGESSTGNSSSTGSSSDGDTGSTDEGATDGSMSTSDSAQSGSEVCTDSYFGSSVGSADGSSADGGSEGDECPDQGVQGAGPRAVAMNYFEMFRLSHIPMAIASKDNSDLVGANQAMMNFMNKSEEEIVKLKIGSLVAEESRQELESAVHEMLSVNGNAHPSPTQEVIPPFSTNAGIGERPALLTFSLVRDDQGLPLMIHLALFPRHNESTEGVPPQGELTAGNINVNSVVDQRGPIRTDPEGVDSAMVIGVVGDPSSLAPEAPKKRPRKRQA
ncbi:unnamed protein product [Discosporangium mesarthrocarpum]